MDKECILFVQFSNSMFIRHDACDHYWDTFYKTCQNEGYYVGKEVFEIPKWIAEIAYFSNKYNKEIQWCRHSVKEVIDNVSKNNYKIVLFSLMNANQDFIHEIIKQLPLQKFVIGGYNEKFLKMLGETYDNVTICDTTEDSANAMGCQFKFGTDYSLFKGEHVVPRLTLSYGCLNRCKFCIVPHGKITSVPKEVIDQQIDSFSDLDFRLIYIDDKTFGQADNYTYLKNLTQRLIKRNKAFNGFIVQTTSGMVKNRARIFNEIGVKVTEIGLETYNDEILRKYNKPSSERFIQYAVEAAKQNNLKLLPNIIIGFPEETEKTYIRTFDYVMPLLEKGDIIGINPAIYTDYNNDDNLGEIDFFEDEKTELHRKWWTKFNNAAAEILLKNKNNKF